MHMNFLELLNGAEVLWQKGNPAVSGLQYDSRKVNPGDLFLAMRGESSDGNQFIDRAIEAGAVAIVSDSAGQSPRPRVAWAQVAHGRQALAMLSAKFYGHPAEKLAITGITGTNGKSTTAFLLESILKAAGRGSALIGTIEYHVAGDVHPAPHTTPESLELNSIFSAALSSGASEVVMEVSSHALAQQRVYGISFDTAVFTNLTRDHLDYHHSMDEYFAAKKILFEGCGGNPPRAAVINIEDSYGRQVAEVSKHLSPEVISYGFASGNYFAQNVELTSQGIQFDLSTPQGPLPVFSRLVGRVNVFNIVAAAAAAFARSVKKEAVIAGIANLARVPGRFERVNCDQPFTVVVDYAHTDDALRNLTILARELLNGKGKVITVFGCGGDRDRSKRRLMGEAAGENSDLVVLTSDNPRSEDPLAIMNDAAVGLQRCQATYKMEPDRAHAISTAIQAAKPGDIVLIAGKGHEKLQITREGTRRFDDVEVARDALRERGYSCESAAVAGKKQ